MNKRIDLSGELYRVIDLKTKNFDGEPKMALKLQKDKSSKPIYFFRFSTGPSRYARTGDVVRIVIEKTYEINGKNGELVTIAEGTIPQAFTPMVMKVVSSRSAKTTKTKNQAKNKAKQKQIIFEIPNAETNE